MSCSWRWSLSELFDGLPASRLLEGCSWKSKFSLPLYTVSSTAVGGEFLLILQVSAVK